MTAWCTRLLSELDASDARAIEIAAKLTPDELNWKARPEEWSVGQCLEHLCITNDVYLPPIEDALAGRSHAAVDAIAPGRFSQWFIRSYIAPSPQTKRARAPGKTTPASNIAPSVVERFLASNREARRIALLAQDLDVNRIRFRNPFVPLLRFTVGTGLEIVSKHEARHLLQAERVRQTMQLLTPRQ